MHTHAEHLQEWVTRYAEGDDVALNELLQRSMDRLEVLTRVMFRDFVRLRRWEETGDVLQNASLRLCRALLATRPVDVRGFLALASLQIRRELTDLVRRHFGPEGIGANHETLDSISSDRSSTTALPVAPASGSFDPGKLAIWSEFHREASQLPNDEREVFDLIYYHGFSQIEAARVLDISERTLQRRWQTARLNLHDALNGQLP